MSKTNPNETNPVTDFFKELFSPISSFVYTGIGAALSTIFALKLTKTVTLHILIYCILVC